MSPYNTHIIQANNIANLDQNYTKRLELHVTYICAMFDRSTKTYFFMPPKALLHSNVPLPQLHIASDMFKLMSLLVAYSVTVTWRPKMRSTLSDKLENCMSLCTSSRALCM
jgi:hypothetical protein